MAQAHPDDHLQEKPNKETTKRDEKREISSFKFNAQAPEFVPSSRTPQSPVSGYFYPCFGYMGMGGNDGSGSGDWIYAGAGDQDQQMHVFASPNVMLTNCSKNVLTQDLQQKIIKQVEYQFSGLSLLANESLVKHISKDPEGYVPISVIASMKKIKSCITNNNLLAQALRSSSKLVVSNDGKKVKRKHPFTEKDKEELQSRTVVGENLPEDHSHQNLEKIFSVVGRLLQNNRILGPLPVELGRLPKLQTLDLSNNMLTGEIPPSLANIKTLQYLRLNNNTLTGPIPQPLANMTQLTFLDLSYNNLSGPVPKFQAKTFNIMGNPVICATGVEQDCNGTTPIPMSFTLGSQQKSQPSVAPKTNKMALAFGTSLGCFCLLFFGFGFAFWWRRRFNQQVFFDINGEFKMLDSTFNNYITVVAVKRLKDGNAVGGEIQFQTEVEMISLAVHRNLLRQESVRYRDVFQIKELRLAFFGRSWSAGMNRWLCNRLNKKNVAGLTQESQRRSPSERSHIGTASTAAASTTTTLQPAQPHRTQPSYVLRICAMTANLQRLGTLFKPRFWTWFATMVQL